MQQLLLRGYVTPEDFTGNDTQRLQQALDTARELDLRKVVLAGSYAAQTPLTVFPGLHLCIQKGACLKADLESPLQTNYSFALEWLCIDGGGRLEGNIRLFNCAHAALQALTVTGTVSLEYCRWVRMEDCAMGLLQLGKGCSECIFQRLSGPVVMDTALGCGKTVAGIEPSVRSVMLRNSRCDTDAPALTLRASEGAGFVNILAEGLTAKDTAVSIGHSNMHLDPRHYWGLTLTNLDAPTTVCSRTPLVQSLVD